MPNKTLLSPLFREVAKLFERAAAGNLKSRAATVGEIWSYIQDQLEAEWVAENPGVQTAMSDDMGNEWSMCPSYVLDVYLNDKGTFALVTKSDGKLYKIPVTVGKDNVITTEPAVEVFMEALPVVGRQVSIKRQADGSVRWFAMPACTAVLNRSGEIDSTKLFDSFVEHIMRTEDYPVLDFYHLGDAMPLGKADWVGRDGIAYCASGIFDDSDIARAAIKSLEESPDYWGLSIAYLPTSEPTVIRSDDANINVYNTGINRFISLLPEHEAASILTSISTKEEVTRMNAKVKEALRKLSGGDESLVESLGLKIDNVNRSASGMISRDTTNPSLLTPAPVTSSTVPVVPLTTPAAVEARALSTEDITALLADPAFEAKVVEIINKMEAAEAQADLDAANAALQTNSRSEITLLRQAINSLTLKMNAIERAKQEDEQVLEEDTPAKLRGKPTVLRPRATIQPILNSRGNMDMQAAAARTLEKLEAARA